MHTTKKTARLITGKLYAHYLLILKANQPLALQAAQALLSGTDTQFADHTAIDIDRGHGRTERRTLRLAPADDNLFPGARQVFRLRRDTGGLDGQRTNKQLVYGIASMPAELAGPAQLNHYTREHWCVENRLHWTRSAMSRFAKTTPNYAPAPPHGLWPASATSHSTPTDWPAKPTSPTPAATYTTAPTPSPSTAYSKPSPNRTEKNNAGALPPGSGDTTGRLAAHTVRSIVHRCRPSIVEDSMPLRAMR
jgi:hypothetical protein